jgi:N-acetylglucosaminyldiphosphoundecaprenol N-acetyl-beta-D-mannosaminyltransferase
MPMRLPFLGLDFDPLTADAAARSMAWRARLMGPFAYVSMPNVDHIVRMDRAPQQKSVYADAWLTLCDSRVLELFAEASYIDLPAAPGADVVEILFRDHIRPTDRITLVGGTQVMADALRAKFGLTNLAWFDAPQNLATDAEARAQCVRFIQKHPANFVFLAVGSPQQEIIAQEARATGACSGVAICCGAALETLSGEKKRAPEWMRRRRLEWLFRLASEPGRMSKRYLIDGPRIFWIWARWRNEPSDASVTAKGMALSLR